MPLVTLIGERLANEGDEFIYIGPNNDCKNCKLKTVCFNLKPGRHYEITKIRDKRHSCSVHDGNTAVVEVKELPILTSIDEKLSEGNTTTIKDKECRNIGCVHFELCNSMALQKDKTYNILEIYERIDCPIGYNLQKAKLTD